jgi:uncharacterized protein YecE (DUF72 family)
VSHELRIGTSGWNYASWRGVLYEPGVPQRRWLERYAEEFDTVELNASFYRLPPVEQFASWKERTPRGFAFAVKGSRFITHVKRLRGADEAIATFCEHARALGRKGAVALWQLPPSLACDVERLAAFCQLLPKGRTRRQAIEFRHESWYLPEVYELLQRRGVALVLPDSAADRSMTAPDLHHTAGFTYVRFHYGRGAGGDYTARQLEQWAERIAAWRRGRDVYVYFNNDWEGFAVRNARRLKEILGVGGDGRPRARRAA